MAKPTNTSKIDLSSYAIAAGALLPMSVMAGPAYLGMTERSGSTDGDIFDGILNHAATGLAANTGGSVFYNLDIDGGGTDDFYIGASFDNNEFITEIFFGRQNTRYDNRILSDYGNGTDSAFADDISGQTVDAFFVGGYDNDGTGKEQASYADLYDPGSTNGLAPGLLPLDTGVSIGMIFDVSDAPGNDFADTYGILKLALFTDGMGNIESIELLDGEYGSTAITAMEHMPFESEEPTNVSAPASLALLAGGLLGAGAARRRKSH